MLEPGTYHLHTHLNITSVGPGLAPGQTITVTGESSGESKQPRSPIHIPPPEQEFGNFYVPGKDGQPIVTYNSFIRGGGTLIFTIILATALGIIWKFTALRIIIVFGIFISSVSLFYLFPTMCMLVSNLFRVPSCGTSAFAAFSPFMAMMFILGIFVLVYSLRSKE